MVRQCVSEMIDTWKKKTIFLILLMQGILQYLCKYFLLFSVHETGTNFRISDLTI